MAAGLILKMRPLVILERSGLSFAVSVMLGYFLVSVIEKYTIVKKPLPSEESEESEEAEGEQEATADDMRVPLAMRPFPLPALIARKAIPPERFDYKNFYRCMHEYYKKSMPRELEVFYDKDYPGYFFPATGARAPLEFDAQDLQLYRNGKQSERIGAFDSSIVQLGEQEAEVDEFYDPIGGHIANFQKVYNNPVCSLLTPFDAMKADEPLSVSPAWYRTGVGFCEGNYLAKLSTWNATSTCRSFEEALKSNQFPVDQQPGYPLIGVCVLTLGTLGDVLLKRRGSHVASYPNTFHVAPSGQLETVIDYNNKELLSVFCTFLREFNEELFDGDEELRNLAHVLSTPRMRQLAGTLTFLGYGVNLVRRDVDIVLLFTPDPDWLKDHRDEIKMCWEYKTKHPEWFKLCSTITKTEKDPFDYNPAATFALRTAMSLPENSYLRDGLMYPSTAKEIALADHGHARTITKEAMNLLQVLPSTRTRGLRKPYLVWTSACWEKGPQGRPIHRDQFDVLDANSRQFNLFVDDTTIVPTRNIKFSWRDSEGEFHLGNKPYLLLIHMLRYAGTPLPDDEIAGKLWTVANGKVRGNRRDNDRTVEQALYDEMKRLRKGLRDSLSSGPTNFNTESFIPRKSAVEGKVGYFCRRNQSLSFCLVSLRDRASDYELPSLQP